RREPKGGGLPGKRNRLAVAGRPSPGALPPPGVNEERRLQTEAAGSAGRVGRLRRRRDQGRGEAFCRRPRRDLDAALTAARRPAEGVGVEEAAEMGWRIDVVAEVTGLTIRHLNRVANVRQRRDG